MTKEDKKALATEIDNGSYVGIMEIKDTGYFMPVIRMRRSGYVMLDHFQKLVPGRRAESKTKETGSTEYWINWQGKKVYQIIELILPYLEKKLTQAKLILDFRNSVEGYRKINGKYHKLSDEERARRREYVRRIGAANRNLEYNPTVGSNKVPRETGQYDGSHLNPYIADEIGLVQQPPVAPSDQDEIKSIFD